ncbi:hypothetical protein GQ457_07G010150 [Hibiscus cannabinus]
MRIASLGKARRQGGSSITFVQVQFCGYGSVNKQWGGYALFEERPKILHFWCRVSIPYQWYRYPIPTLESGYRYLLERVSVPLVMHQVSVPREGYRYPSSPLGLEYRYWLPSTDIGCLKTDFGTP